MNEGPKKVVIPQQEFITCSGCRHFNHRMRKSGRDPIYIDICEHPEVRMSGTWFEGNLDSNYLNIVETPDWCPLLSNLKT